LTMNGSFGIIPPAWTTSPLGDSIVQTIYVKFLTENNRARGFFELAKRSTVGSLPGGVYQIPLEAVKLLEDLKIDFRRATDAEVKDAHDQARNPSPSVL
ncbi:MAG: hypothetical protein L0219_16900, partial [Phycisphaerales bacterium]|nr:hypothetical protein [Phycisphaerales bacterium]